MCLPVLTRVAVALSFLAVMQESTGILAPTYRTNDSSFVSLSGCNSKEYYEKDNGCNKLNTTSASGDILIGEVGPDIEGSYCCDSACNDCTNYSSPEFIAVDSKIDIQLIATASQSFILETMEYFSIGKVSRDLLIGLEFRILENNSTQLDYGCELSSSSQCADSGKYSINKTSYALNISWIDPNISAFRIETLFYKYDDSVMHPNEGPTFYIRGNFISIVCTFHILHSTKV